MLLIVPSDIRIQISLDVPAIDRAIDYLEGKRLVQPQKDIDGLAASLTQAADELIAAVGKLTLK